MHLLRFAKSRLNSQTKAVKVQDWQIRIHNESVSLDYNINNKPRGALNPYSYEAWIAGGTLDAFSDAHLKKDFAQVYASSITSMAGWQKRSKHFGIFYYLVAVYARLLKLKLWSFWRL